MSSNLRCCACLRACASSRLVLSSSTETRRPRSAIKSMTYLLDVTADRQSAPGPTLPHSQLEDLQVGRLQKTAGRDHHVGRAYAAPRVECRLRHPGLYLLR